MLLSLFLLQFFVAVEREREENCPEYFLLTEYHSEGSLKQYLQHNTVSWYRMCILSRSVAAGLAYLHQDGECEEPRNVFETERFH